MNTEQLRREKAGDGDRWKEVLRTENEPREQKTHRLQGETRENYIFCVKSRAIIEKLGKIRDGHNLNELNI